MASRTSRGSSRRIVVSPVKKPFPWGFAAGSAVLAVALIAILVFAVLNTGSGFRTAADRLDETFDGLQVNRNPSADHINGRADYPDLATRAPNSGNHNGYPQQCAVYTEPVVPEHAVHSLEHGAVWVTYRPDLPADQVALLAGLVEGNPNRMLSPYPGLSSPVSLQAWGRTLAVDSATDSRVERFLDEYSKGPQTREINGTCSGVSVPGTEPFTIGPDGSFVPESALANVPPAPAPGELPPAGPGQIPADPAPGSDEVPVPSLIPAPVQPSAPPTG